MQDEEVKDYVNADLAYLSYKEFCEKFDTVKPDNTNFIDNLEWALLYLNLNKPASPARYNEMEEDIFHLNTFDGAWLLDVDRLGEASNKMIFLKPFSDQATLSMFKNFNLKTFRLGSREDLQNEATGNENEKGMTMLQKYRLLDSKEVRHLKGVPKVVERRIAIASKDEKWYTFGNYYVHMELQKNGEHISVPYPTTINKNYYYKPSDIRAYTEKDEYLVLLQNFNMFLNLKLTAYYEWFVYIRENDKSLGIKIPIVPESAKEVFALRDTPEGEKRKKAICHFVKQHYRTVKNEYNEEIRQSLVKQHLRGETKFNWRGLQVNIIPAEYDLNRIKTRKKYIEI